MTRDSLAKAFLKAAGGALASAALRGAADTAAARGDQSKADLARAAQAAVDARAAGWREALHRHVAQAKGAASPPLWPALYEIAGQLLDEAGPEQSHSGPSGAECFLRGAKATSAAQAQHWWMRGAALGDPDCQRRLERYAAGSPLRAATPAPATIGATTGRAQALEILGLREGATEKDIRAAYHRLMRQMHPDKGGSEFFAKQLNLAKRILIE